MISYSEPLSKLEKIELYALSVHARELKQHLRYVNYQQAEEACWQLANQLQTLFSASELAQFSFLPIPRGGFIVLGMLAYALNLRPDQLLTSHHQAQSPLVIVDDCALSGLRFREYLEKTAVTPIIFAHLYSPRSLRESIEAKEARVTHCIAAYDLEERPLPATPHPTLGSQYYWEGSPEIIAFAWREPTLLTSLLATNRENLHWHLVSPQACLHNRMVLGVWGMPAPTPAVYVPDSLLYQWDEGELLLVNSTTGEFYKLKDLPAAMWRALAVLGDPISALNWLQTDYHVAQKHVAQKHVAQKFATQESVEAFMETAVGAGFLANIQPG